MATSTSLTLVLLIGTCAPAAIAQTVPAIVADTVPNLNLGTQVNTVGSNTLISGGSLVGANLFHSFASFGVPAGQQATWSYSGPNPAGIQNVISRVTGGAPSVINGRLNSTIPNADFYFLNPSGVIFGDGAVVNLTRALTVATASELRLDGGGVFSSSGAGGSVLTSAPPEAFGFLGDSGAISIARASLSASGSIRLAASDISIAGANILASCPAGGCLAGARGGIRMTAVGSSAADVDFGARIPDPTGGAISIASGSRILSLNTGAAPGGDVTIEGASVSLGRNTTLSSETRGSAAAGDVFVIARDLTIDGGDLTSLSRGEGNSGSIMIRASGDVVIRDSDNDPGAVATRSTGSSSGSVGGRSGDVTILVGGDLSIESDAVAAQSGVNSGAEVSVGAGAGTGGPGSIRIVVGRDFISRGGYVSSQNDARTNAGQVLPSEGQISISARNLLFASLLDPASGGSVRPSVTAFSTGGRDAGDITLAATDSIEGAVLADSAAGLDITRLSAGETQAGAGGDIRLSAGRFIDLSGSLIRASIEPVLPRIDADNLPLPQSPGAGSIALTAGEMIRLRSTQVSTATSASNPDANGGAITLQSSEIFLIDSLVDSGTTGAQAGGEIGIHATLLRLVDGSTISTSSTGTGQAGRIVVNAPDMDLNASRISSSAGVAPAGAIALSADNLRLVSGAQITTDSLGAAAGAIVLTLDRRGWLFIENAQITTSSGVGLGGRITIGDPVAVITDGGSILALGEARTSDVRISADYWIASSDALNLLSVDGELLLEASIQDVTSGASTPDLTFADPNALMHTRCRVAPDVSGRSVLVVVPPGPYAVAPTRSPGAAGPKAGCQ